MHPYQFAHIVPPGYKFHQQYYQIQNILFCWEFKLQVFFTVIQRDTQLSNAGFIIRLV